MLAVRRLVSAPATQTRSMCALISHVKSMEAKAQKMEATLPEGLKEIAQRGPSITADLESFAKDRPELFKEVMAKIKEADAPGIMATVPAAKDPKACKYTEEGTMLHQLMQNVAKSDRRIKTMVDLEVTLTAADKDAIVQGALAKAAEAGLSPEQLKGLDLSVPAKMKIM